MKEFSAMVGGIILAMAAIFFVSCLSGTILYCIYPHIHTMFPTAASKGVIAKELDWWDAICITWIFSILIRSSSSYNSSKKRLIFNNKNQ